MKNLFNNRGSILAQVLIIFMILSILCLVLIGMTNMDFKIFRVSQDSLVAYYVAESGLEIALQNEAAASGAITYPYPHPVEIKEGSNVIGRAYISKDGDAIVSKGVVGNLSRTVETTYDKRVNDGGNTLEDFWNNPWMYEREDGENVVDIPRNSGDVTNVVAKYDFIYVYGNYTGNNIGGENKNKPAVVVIDGNFYPNNKVTFYGILYVTGEIRLQDGSELHGYVYSDLTRTDAIDVVQRNGKAQVNGYIVQPEDMPSHLLNYNHAKIKTTLPTLKNKDERDYFDNESYAYELVKHLFGGTPGSIDIIIKTWREVR